MPRRPDCDQSPVPNIEEWFPTARPHWDAKRSNRIIDKNWEIATSNAGVEVLEPEAVLEERFRQLADNWAENTRHISSINDLISHPSYQKIIRLGWDVVPLLLIDLQKN